ncbi:hypothetical protein IMG5_201990 [Ichthyophthirius multifiliis]|uniref:MPN domain-containing protein n=1 Tax=Ichthyophthirius multifiliis TaxID=5932 RepID=G0R616_ICHMU|nr:hypothetical protein IMG5_201990 [Ichthyophthirius multifiliis]EGR27082.1 hypothetical protein IMG5_201990 [Ichthyophthirius multifiliis]|eukprot:XP_004023966.1 hypothetical protein IMG5_201990 [Ichthyophthirius multifiliis]
MDIQQFEEQNNINNDESIYIWDEQEQDDILEKQEWKKDPNYFKKCKISLLAVLKMLTHARMGGHNEVMGLFQGKIKNDTIIVMDSFALPVEATETRVNASSDCNEFIIQQVELLEKAGKMENVRGWYHSHPSYGCWLSGIDVQTQTLQQKADPMLAIVIDPIRTMASGKIEIGAFRTYPENFNKQVDQGQNQQVIPLDKIEDWGVHYKKYYALEVSFFKTNLDSEIIEVLWNKYWINTITQSAIFINKEYFVNSLNDLSNKMKNAKNKGRKGDTVITVNDLLGKNSLGEKEPIKYALEKNQALVNESIKNLLFQYQF